MLILSHPTGNENVRQAVRSLHDAELLSEFWTSVYWRQEYLINKILPHSIRNELSRRTFPYVRHQQVRSHPWREAGRLMARRLGLSTLIRHEVGRLSVDAVYRSLDKKVATQLLGAPEIEAVYAYEDGALTTFRVAQRLAIKTIYELPIGYWRAGRELMEEEADLQPEWAMTLPGNIDSAQKLHRKDEELALASHIVVPSEYVRRTLSKAPQVNATVSVVPYGAPAAIAGARKMTAPSDPLRVVFVGALTQRKGVSYLLRAVEQLGSSVVLTLIGRRVGECRALDAALRVHRWFPSLSHAQVLQELNRQDVMVFPSLFEGFGLVLLEAMANGVPVIGTPNGAAPDLLTDGEDGFLIPIRDTDVIVEKLELLARDRERLSAMSASAARKAALHSWRRYRELLATTVHSALADNKPSRSNLRHLFHASA